MGGNDHENYDCVSMYHCCGSAPERNLAGTSSASESESAAALVSYKRIWQLRLHLRYTEAMLGESVRYKHYIDLLSRSAPAPGDADSLDR
jgi:hypothetical protein